MINTARPSLHNGGEASADDCTIRADGASTPVAAAMRGISRHSVVVLDP
jgi:hypothetical protein